jgi:hypothetical protein
MLYFCGFAAEQISLRMFPLQPVEHTEYVLPIELEAFRGTCRFIGTVKDDGTASVV